MPTYMTVFKISIHPFIVYGFNPDIHFKIIHWFSEQKQFSLLVKYLSFDRAEHKTVLYGYGILSRKRENLCSVMASVFDPKERNDDICLKKKEKHPKQCILFLFDCLLYTAQRMHVMHSMDLNGCLFTFKFILVLGST